MSTAFRIPRCKVLVLVPSYRHAKYLTARMESILTQTWKGDVHVLVIDDASPDETEGVLKRYEGRPNVTIYRRPKNSGSPFSAWQDVAENADCEFLWIAESDDACEPVFLEAGMRAFEEAPTAVLYYVHSWYTTASDELCGHSLNYLRQQFPSIDWMRSQKISGADYNNRAQIFGNALPNMSSALMRMGAFRKAFDKSYRQFRLAADWCFVGRLAAQGDVLFDHRTHNFFRTHEATSRASTKLELTCAEYWRAITLIGELPGVEKRNTQESLERTLQMFLYERGSFISVARSSLNFGIGHNLRLANRFLVHSARRPEVKSLVRRYFAASSQPATA